MNALDPGKSYRQIATRTAPPGQLVQMLYDGAVRFLHQALEGFQYDDPVDFNQTIHNNIQRAQDIIAELNISLDMERGGEFAQNMRRLYEYFDLRLQQSNLKKEEDGIREVLKLLSVLQEAWSKMLRGHVSDVAEPVDLVAA
jgi:flagellar protein FliS